MKKLSKVLVLVLSAIMVFAMSASVFAANATADGKVTVSGVESGDTVKLYQVVEWTTNVGWTFVSPFTGLTDTQKEAVLAGNITSSLAETIAEMAPASATKTDSSATTSREITVDPGLYLVLVTPKESGTIYNPAFVASDYNGENTTNAINMSTAGYGSETIMKKSTIIVTKTVDGTTAHSTDGHSLGDDLNFTISTKIPSYPANSTYATLTISDTPDGMTIDPETVVVKVGDTVVYSETVTMPTATGTVTASGTKLVVDFAKAYILANGGKAVTVTYTAELTTVDEEEGTAENPVVVTYNPNPFVDTTNEVRDIDEVKTYGLVFEKTDTNGVALEGAVFDLYDATGETKITDENGYFVTATTKVVNDHAYVYWAGLKAGTYTVKETTAPEGYMKVEDFTITLSSTAATADNPATTATENNYNASRTGTSAVQDPTGVDLPATGGIGTTIFYIVGSLLVVGCGIVLVSRKRMQNNK